MNVCQTNLSKLTLRQERTKHWDEESKMFIFNRNRIFFEWILHFYQSNGKLYIPKVMSDKNCSSSPFYLYLTLGMFFIITMWMLEHHVDVGTPCGCWNTMWMLEHHVDVGTPCGCWKTMWMLEHHVDVGTPCGCWNTMWMLEHYVDV